jgi:hypothetical protein
VGGGYTAENPRMLVDANTGTKLLPAAGLRNVDGDGQHVYQGQLGWYWSSTVQRNQNNTGGAILHFGEGLGSTDPAVKGSRYGSGNAVRCVPAVATPEPVGVRAPKGVIGYYPNPTNPALKDKLTLEGDKDLGGTSGETVHVAYFKYGSLVALKAPVGGDQAYLNPATDMVVPDMLDITTPTSYHNVPFVSSNALQQHLDKTLTEVYANTSSETTGRGDPCDFFFKEDGAQADLLSDAGRWRMPTEAESRAYINTVEVKPASNPSFADPHWLVAKNNPNSLLLSAAGMYDGGSYIIDKGYHFTVGGKIGVYWTSSYGSSSSLNPGEPYGIYFNFAGASVNLNTTQAGRRAAPIRCVPDNGGSLILQPGTYTLELYQEDGGTASLNEYENCAVTTEQSMYSLVEYHASGYIVTNNYRVVRYVVQSYDPNTKKGLIAVYIEQ